MNKKIFLSNSSINFSSNLINSDQKYIIDFENSIENYLGEHKYAVALHSGTAAIHLALILLGVTKGDEVICQSFTFVASANPIMYQGATPVFIDSEHETWNMCPMFLRAAILDRISKGKKPKAILFVHTYGMPAKVDEIVAISKEFNIPLIEDAAGALGAKYKGKKCGTFGDFAIFSFNNNKIITTFGGGSLICKNKKQKEHAVFLSTQAKEQEVYYQHTKTGFNYRLSNVLAGIGAQQINNLENNLQKRRKIHQFYKHYFSKINGVTLFEEPEIAFSNYWLSTILIDEKLAGFSSSQLRSILLEANIESRPLWKPMHLQPVFKNFPFYGEHISENLFKKGLCLPSGALIETSDLNRITAVIDKLL